MTLKKNSHKLQSVNRTLLFWVPQSSRGQGPTSILTVSIGALAAFVLLLRLNKTILALETIYASDSIVCMVITCSKSMDQPGKVACPARGQLNRINRESHKPTHCHVGDHHKNRHGRLPDPSRSSSTLCRNRGPFRGHRTPLRLENHRTPGAQNSQCT